MIFSDRILYGKDLLEREREEENKMGLVYIISDRQRLQHSIQFVEK